jgi:glycerol-3-phosphate acyltransferase PlsX
MVQIAIDAMGGDFAPRAVIEGVGEALDRFPAIGRLLLTGPRDQIESELDLIGRKDDERITIVHTDQVIGMHESPAAAIRAKPRSSIATAVELVKQGQARAVISAGHTGAAVASTVLKLRTLPGIERPGIATVFPAPTGSFLLLDAGANVDSKPRHLAQYAVMGEIYSREILKVASPRIGLLNVGSEEGKGNELAKLAHDILKGMKGINFVGNIEGRDLFADSVDVVICDGFVGNVVLKCCESLAKAFGGFLGNLLRKSPVRMTGALLCKGAFSEFKTLCDYAEYGGAPLLGVNGVCIIGHGSSSSVAIRNAIRVAIESVEHHLNDHIVERVQELGVAGAAKAGNRSTQKSSEVSIGS